MKQNRCRTRQQERGSPGLTGSKMKKLLLALVVALMMAIVAVGYFSDETYALDEHN